MTLHSLLRKVGIRADRITVDGRQVHPEPYELPRRGAGWDRAWSELWAQRAGWRPGFADPADEARIGPWLAGPWKLSRIIDKELTRGFEEALTSAFLFGDMSGEPRGLVSNFALDRAVMEHTEREMMRARLAGHRHLPPTITSV